MVDDPFGADFFGSPSCYFDVCGRFRGNPYLYMTKNANPEVISHLVFTRTVDVFGTLWSMDDAFLIEVTEEGRTEHISSPFAQKQASVDEPIKDTDDRSQQRSAHGREKGDFREIFGTPGIVVARGPEQTLEECIGANLDAPK